MRSSEGFGKLGDNSNEKASGWSQRLFLFRIGIFYAIFMNKLGKTQMSC